MHSFRSAFVRAKKSRLRRFLSHDMPSGPFHDALPKTLWMFWQQGLDTAPDIVSVCIDSWRRRNPDWDIRVLDGDSFAEYVAMDDVSADRVPISAWANFLRMRLLLKYGGVWADATTYCSTPLNAWLPMLMSEPFFVFSNPGRDRMVSNWFMASTGENAHLRTWHDASMAYWEGRTERSIYHWHHYIYEYETRTNPAFRRAARRMPHVWAEPIHIAQRYLVRKCAEPEIDLPPPALTGVPFHKLTWKETINVKDALALFEDAAPDQTTYQR